MSIFAHPQFLRRVLWADAAAGAVSSLLHMLGAEALAPLLGLPQGLIALSGVALIVFVAFAAWLAFCDPIARSAVSVLIAGNFAWVGGCAVVFLMHASTATPMGQAYLIVHALAVAALAELEWFGLRRVPRLNWA